MTMTPDYTRALEAFTLVTGWHSFHAFQLEHGKTVETALRQAAEPWRGIESAPHKGKIIVGYAIVDAKTQNWNMHLISWDEYHKVWDGWPKYMAPPTHWQPLPAPPQGDGEKD